MRPTILIVDDVAETRASIGRLLELTEGFQVVGEAVDGREAIEKAGQLRPDCILLDVNMPVMDGIAAAEVLSVENPEVAVVMMSVQGEQEYLRKAMAAGARDYLVKPFGPEEISETIRRAVQGIQRRKPEAESVAHTRVVLVAGPKGGVGRTTVAANVALGLAMNGESTCLVDLNAQFSDLAMTLDIVPAQTLASLARVEALAVADVLGALEEHPSGLRMLAAPARPEESEAVSSDLVEQVMSALQGSYQWVIVDMPTQLDEYVLPVLDRQPDCFLVLSPDLAPVRNAGQLMQLMRDLEYDTQKVRVVLNRWDARSAVTPEVIERNLGMKLSERIPYDPDAMRVAATRGVPVVKGDPKSASARVLTGLVDELLGKVEAVPKRRTFGLAKRETRLAMG